MIGTTEKKKGTYKMSGKSKLGVYLISESGCLRPGSGANKHILAGIQELGKQFSMQQVLLCEPYKKLPAAGAGGTAPAISSSKRKTALKTLKSFIKWPVLLLKNHAPFFSYYRKVKKLNPDFIYERSAYLNYNGLLIAKLLRIPHFYEVNGIQSYDHRKYYPGIWNRVANWLEKVAYNHSSMGFYIGGINHEMGIKPARAVITQNGIEKEFVDHFSNKVVSPDSVLHVAFIGYVMDHHRLDVLCKAMHLVKNRHAFHLHLIGTGMDTMRDQLPPDLELTCHGLLDHKNIGTLLRDIHVGVIPYALAYYSNVKTFLYGAGKLATIVPEARNFMNIFSREEVLFIRNADEVDLADKLDFLQQHPEIVKEYGEKIYQKIQKEFTWQQIFRHKGQVISEFL